MKSVKIRKNFLTGYVSQDLRETFLSTAKCFQWNGFEQCRNKRVGPWKDVELENRVTSSRHIELNTNTQPHTSDVVW